MEITLKTLTPIWTGGVETGKMDRIHETGLIGSLRWWYEAIVRGLGGEACDPTSDNPEERCQFDTKAYEKTKRVEDGLANVCPVCQIFGCTGWRRRFELQASATQFEKFWLATKDKPNKFNHWWLSEIYNTGESYVAWGGVTLHFRWMRGYKNQHEIMKALLSVVSRLGAIGSKPQYGFGIVAYEQALSVTESLSIIQKNIVALQSRKNLSRGHSSLHNYWLLQCGVPQEDIEQKFASTNVIGCSKTFQKYKPLLLPVSFDIRYKFPNSNDKGLRQSYRLEHGKMSTRHVFGTLKGSEKDKRASAVFVSHLYKENVVETDYQLRVWGFTDAILIDKMEISLKNIFPNLNVNRKQVGAEFLAEKEVSR